MISKPIVAGFVLLAAGVSGTVALVTSRVEATETVEIVAFKCIDATDSWSWSDTAIGCPSGTTTVRFVVPDACEAGYCVECPPTGCVDDDPQTVALLCCEPISGEFNCFQIQYMSECQNDWDIAACLYGQTNADGTETCFY
jgi:hypothetical protein